MAGDRFNNPFASLGPLRGSHPAGADPPVEVAPGGVGSGLVGAKAVPTRPGPTYPRAVVRMERAGRGGKEATVIEQLALSPTEREAWLKALKAALGCGGSISGDTLMLQGDQRERLKKVLVERGVKRVIIG